MKINRIYLENYRIHEKLEVEFDKGINLLLGENGKGKSSILEAIGYALFGSDLRGTQKDAIQYGKKSAKIQVEFTGVDGEEYIVTRKLPGTTSIYRKSNPELELQGKEDRIRELCGIKGDIKDVYDNVIVAKQNEFISSFKATAKDREKTFDKVFNTEIYREIYDGYSKDVEGKYKNEIAIEENSIKSISDIIEDSQEVKEKLELEEEREKEFEKYLNNLSAELKEIKEKLNQISGTELKIEKINGEIRKSEEVLNSITLQEEKLKKQIEETILAKEIADKNIENHNEYIKTSEILESIKKEKKELDQIKEEQSNLEKSLVSLEKLRGDSNNQVNLWKNSIENLKVSCREKKDRVDFLQGEIEKKEKNLQVYKGELEKNIPLLEELERFESDIENGEKTLSTFIVKLQEKESDLEIKKEQRDNLIKERLDEKIEEFKRIENDKKKIEGEIEKNITLGIANKEAHEKLKSSICPFLNENCKNLSGKDINNFFLERRKRYVEIITDKKHQLEELEVKLKDKEKIVEMKTILNRLNHEIELKISEIEVDQAKFQRGEEKLKNKKLEYENWKLINSIKNREEILAKNTQLETKIENENSEKDIIERDKIKNILNEDIERGKELKEKIEEKLLEIKEFSLKEKEIRNSIEENKPALVKYQELSEEVEKYETLLNSLKESNELYLENYKKALEKESLEIEKEGLKEKESQEEKVLESLRENLIKLENSLVSLNKEELEKSQVEKDEKVAEIREKLGGINGEIKNLNDKLAKIKEHENIIKDKKKSLEKLKMKLELTKAFRERIKSMGKEVSKNMLKEIEILATENFRKITGRGEKVIWSNEDKDKYSVYLSGDRGELRFEQLSGGEQVAVAISIRGAMSELFTESRFSIFDEPTNNLDSERRKSLADSIGEILKNLEQSIIVTHDDTFREMAQKVIEL
ncbi:MAG: SMC family ATPase [Fusobacterium sp.]|uniref:SMC family ATPase n=1 Tax=Fusobacterium sp. TaxID=68766 RepID=UPI00294233E3|nr:SMC family ATPase [Fusobacterium sp.]MDY3059658.1 SMC family ATPase [Fusobacterium sp.]